MRDSVQKFSKGLSLKGKRVQQQSRFFVSQIKRNNCFLFEVQDCGIL